MEHSIDVVKHKNFRDHGPVFLGPENTLGAGPGPAQNEILGPRSKTSERMKYEAQVQVLKSQIGDLEMIRTKLGLSQRKICQLLMVDPSAWSRWMKDGNAPPHIYRALQWYLALQEKIPGLTNEYFLGTRTLNSMAETTFENSIRVAELIAQVEKTQNQVQKLRRTLSALLWSSGIFVLCTAAWLILGHSFLS